MRILFEKVWSYAVELIAAGLICVVLWIWLGGNAVAQWQIEKRTDLLTFTGCATALAGVIFAAYFSVLSTGFGRKLRLHKVAREYAMAFAFPLALFAATTITLVFLDKSAKANFSRSVTFLLCYSCINCITMVRNVLAIVGVWQDSEVS